MKIYFRTWCSASVALLSLVAGCTFRMDRPDASINVEVDAAPDIHYRDLPPPPDRPPCTPTVITCNPPGGQYCGDIGDGCDGIIHCGDCTAPDTCGGTGTPGVCGTPGCVPTIAACTGGPVTYCGVIGDGCGHSIVCGDTCTAPETCGGTGIPNVCGDPACVPHTCSVAGGQYCGNVGDGCGHNLACGDCPTGMACDATSHVCVVPGCSPTLTSCTVSGASYCGVVGDGCSGKVDCGNTCAAGQACGANVHGICGKPNCTPMSCTFQGGQYCGTIGDGCEHSLDCGACPTGTFCDGDQAHLPAARLLADGDQLLRAGRHLLWNDRRRLRRPGRLRQHVPGRDRSAAARPAQHLRPAQLHARRRARRPAASTAA